MNHLKLETSFAYVAGEMSEAEILEVELHLAECADCAAQVRDAGAFDGIFDNVAAVQSLRPRARAFNLQEVLAAGLARANVQAGRVAQRIREWRDALTTPRQVAAAAVRIVVDATGVIFELGGTEGAGQTGVLGPLRAASPAIAGVRGEQASNARGTGGLHESRHAPDDGCQSAGEDLIPCQLREVYAIRDAMARVVIGESGTIEVRVANWPSDLLSPLLILTPLDPRMPPQVQELKPVAGRDYLCARFKRPPSGEHLLAFEPENQ